MLLLLDYTLNVDYEDYIHLMSEEPLKNGVRVTLNLTQIHSLLNFYYQNVSITVFPQAATQNIGKTTIELFVEYNTLFNVSVINKHPCGRGKVITFVELYYSEFILISLGGVPIISLKM